MKQLVEQFEAWVKEDTVNRAVVVIAFEKDGNEVTMAQLMRGKKGNLIEALGAAAQHDKTLPALFNEAIKRLLARAITEKLDRAQLDAILNKSNEQTNEKED